MPEFTVTIWKGNENSRGGRNYKQEFTGVKAADSISALMRTAINWFPETWEQMHNPYRANHATVQRTSTVVEKFTQKVGKKTGLGPWTYETGKTGLGPLADIAQRNRKETTGNPAGKPANGRRLSPAREQALRGTLTANGRRTKPANGRRSKNFR